MVKLEAGGALGDVLARAPAFLGVPKPGRRKLVFNLNMVKSVFQFRPDVRPGLAQVLLVIVPAHAAALVGQIRLGRVAVLGAKFDSVLAKYTVSRSKV